MITVNLRNYQYFDRNTGAVKTINQFFLFRKNIEPRQISSSVGCTFDDSLDILFTLYAKKVARGGIRVYHKLHEFPITELPLENGPPKSRLFCEECEREIGMEEIYYTLVFHIQSEVKFILEPELESEIQ